MPTAIFPFIDKPKPSTPNSKTPDNQTRTALRLEEVARLFRADAGAAGSARVGGAAATSQQVEAAWSDSADESGLVCLWRSRSPETVLSIGRRSESDVVWRFLRDARTGESRG